MPGNGDPLKKVKRGDKQVASETFNCLIDVAQFVRSQQQSRKGEALIGPTLETGKALIQNNTGEDLDRFAVVGLDAPIILPSDDADRFAERIGFSGLSPTLADHRGKFAILQEPVAQGDVAKAIIAGAAIVNLNVIDENDCYADIDEAVTDSLKSSTGQTGAEILWKESGTGAGKRAIIRIGNHNPVRWGTLTEAWEPGTNEITLTPCQGPADDTPIDGADDVTVKLMQPYDLPAIYCGCVEGKIYGYIGIDSGLYQIWPECPLARPSDSTADQYIGWHNASSDPDAPNMVISYEQAG